MIKNVKKFTAEKETYFVSSYSYLSSVFEKDVQVTKETQKKPSAPKREHPALENIKFLLSWVIFALLDPDSEYGSGSIDVIESGSETLLVCFEFDVVCILYAHPIRAHF
jgi:hypothetical protein